MLFNVAIETHDNEIFNYTQAVRVYRDRTQARWKAQHAALVEHCAVGYDQDDIRQVTIHEIIE